VEPVNFLNREDLEKIIEAMTARDIFNAMPSGTEGTEQLQGAQVAGKAFEGAAERQGYGKEVLDRIRPVDAVFLAQELQEVLTVGSPKADSGESLPASPDSGDYPQSS
jgi:hypothetical protein